MAGRAEALRRGARRAPGRLIGHPWVVIALAGLVAFGFWAASTRKQPHHVRVSFLNAVSIAPGLDVQANGVDVGKVNEVKLDDMGRPVVTIGVEDDAWPLHQGTTARLRFGTTIANGDRRIDLEPGPKHAPEIPEGGIISERRTTTPNEFDQVFNTFDRTTRGHIQTLAEHADETLRGRERKLGDGLAASPAALEAIDGVVADLDADQFALSSLVAWTDRVTQTLGHRRARIASLLTVAASTFSAFAENSQQTRDSIARLPGTLRETRTTLARLDRSLDLLDPLVADLRPGAAALRPLAAVARPTLAELRATVPLGIETLRTTRAAAPEITTLLRRARPLMRDLDPALGDLAPMVGCIRPYSPEIAGFFSNWTSFTKNFDGTSHYARVRVVQSPTSDTNKPPQRTDEFLRTAPGTDYAGIRVPGLAAGQPWFLPECGAGPDALDPSKDPEDRP